VQLQSKFTQNCAINYIQLTHKKTLDNHNKTLEHYDETK